MHQEKKTPKRRNAQQTRARILASAQEAFAQLGYSQAGIRDIAALAGVSSPMLLRYFGSKAGLFEAALIDAMRVENLLGTERSRFGKHLIGLFLDVDLDIKPPSIIALSTGDPQARDIATRVAEEHVVRPLAKWLGPPDAHARALEIVTLAMGFVLCSRQFPLVPVKSGTGKKLAVWFAQSIQAIVDQS